MNYAGGWPSQNWTGTFPSFALCRIGAVLSVTLPTKLASRKSRGLRSGFFVLKHLRSVGIIVLVYPPLSFSVTNESIIPW